MLWLLLRLRILVASLLVSTLFAYLLIGPVRWLEALGVRRPMAIFAFTLPFFAAATFLLVLFLPPAIAETVVFFGNVPEYLRRVVDWASPHVYALTGQNIGDAANQWFPEIEGTLHDVFSKALTGAVGIGKGLFAAIAFVLLVPITTFYLLADREQLQRAANGVVPQGHRGWIRALGRAFEVSFGRYLRGLLLVSAIVGTLTGIGLFAIGVGYAAPIGILTGILNLIPFVGFWTSLVLAMIAAALSPGTGPSLLWVPVIFVVINLIEGNFLSPRIVGRQVGIHPIFILFSIAGFSTLFGIAGVFLAIPAALFIKIAIRYARTGRIE